MLNSLSTGEDDEGTLRTSRATSARIGNFDLFASQKLAGFVSNGTQGAFKYSSSLAQEISSGHLSVSAMKLNKDLSFTLAFLATGKADCELAGVDEFTATVLEITASVASLSSSIAFDFSISSEDHRSLNRGSNTAASLYTTVSS